MNEEFSQFNSPDDYFSMAISFLNEFSWIYQYSNTTFVKHRVKDNFPQDWIKYFATTSNENLNNFPSNEIKDSPPQSLQSFLDRVHALRLHKHIRHFTGNGVYFKKMGRKKLHEISRLSQTIEQTCKDDTDILVDFGSGLGYLSEILYRRKNYKILGLECDEVRVKAANDRQDRMYPDSKDRIVYKTHWIAENSDEFVATAISGLQTGNESKIAIIGLHSCADLTVTSMRLFFKMADVQKLIIMPCCHHKMELLETGEFRNFPLSESFSRIRNSHLNSKDILNRPFLRLACQQTAARWRTMSEEDHFEHGRDMFLRGVVESILRDDENTVKLKTKCDSTDRVRFEDIKRCYGLKLAASNQTKEWEEWHENRFDKVVEGYRNGVRLAEGLTCLQATIQDICEDIVLYDRVCYMREFAAEQNIPLQVKVEKIMDESLSPRCYVLIAEKL